MADYIRDASVPVVRGRVAEKPLEEGGEEALGVGAHQLPPEGFQGRRSERQIQSTLQGGSTGLGQKISPLTQPSTQLLINFCMAACTKSCIPVRIP